ncbi:AAA family ATPase [bacterium LRH843]|nr:AAA family ATPase [bacterium LRH843]
MTNILSVRLENFQSHFDTFIEFNHGLNVIVGQSDSGKTAILRGIRWVLYNQPRGTDFLRVGADFVRVTVSFDNGTIIIRERTSSKNRYTIRKNGEEELVLEGFGVHVPEEVLQAHGMGQLRIDHDNELMIHLSQQLDGPFLLEQTSSARAKTLGRISGAHFLDMAIRDMTKDLSQLNQRLKQEQSAIEKLQEELAPYDTLDRMKVQLDQTEVQINKVKLLKQKQKKLQLVQQEKERIEVAEKEAMDSKLLVQQVDLWLNKLKELNEMRTQFVVLSEKRKQNEEIEKAMAVCTTWLNKTEHAQRALKKHEQLMERITVLTKLQAHLFQYATIGQAEKMEQMQLKQASFTDSIPADLLEKVAMNQATCRQLTIIQEQMSIYSIKQRKMNEIINRLPLPHEIEKGQHEVEVAEKRRFRLQEIKSQLMEVKKRIHEGTRFIKQQQEEQEIAEKKWHECLMIEGACPTCGRSM